MIPVASADMFPAATIAHDLRFCDERTRLLARRDGVGSSDVAAVLGDSKYATPLDLWADKTGRVDIDLTTSEAAEWGHTLEPVIAAKFAERFGADLYAAPFILRSDAKQWHTASPDYVIRSMGRMELVECKARYHTWSDGPPQRIVDQCQWQMHVTGIRKCHLVVLFGGLSMPPPWSFIYDPNRCKFLEAKVDEFWGQVRLDQPPAPMAVDTKRMIPGPGEVVLDGDLIEKVAEAKALRLQAKELSAAADALVDPVKVAMAEHDRAVDADGNVVATYRPNAKKTARTLLLKADSR